MSKDSENIGDADVSWHNFLKEIEAETDDKEEQLRILTRRVLEGVVKRLAIDAAEEKRKRKEKKKMKKKKKRAEEKKKRTRTSVIEKKGIERRPGTATETKSIDSVGEAKKDDLVRKQNKIIIKIKGVEPCSGTGSGTLTTYVEEEKAEDVMITKQSETLIQKKGVKRCLGAGSQTSEEGEKEESGIRKHKKQKACNGKKQGQNKRKRLDPMAELTASGLEPPPDMPEEFKKSIENLGGTDIKLVMQKIIYATDMSQAHNRLSMPLSQVRNKFLSEGEEEEVENGGMDVMLVEPCLETSKLHLTKWLLGKSPAYVFKTQWNEVVSNNTDTFKPMAVVQVWSFRAGPESQLGFAMIKVRDGIDEVEVD